MSLLIDIKIFTSSKLRRWTAIAINLYNNINNDKDTLQDSSERDLDLGVTSSGLVVIHNGVKMNTFCWAKIIKISFKRRLFMIQLRREAVSSPHMILGGAL